MKLYAIDKQIEALTKQLEPNPETGEMPENEEEILAKIHRLAARREDTLQDVAKMVLNCRAEAAALKAEEIRLKKRREELEARDGRLVRILDRECGETTNLGVATLQYRKTSRLEVADEAKAVAWLKRHKFTDAFRIPAPTVYKTEVRKLMGAGQKVPGCTVVEDRSCCLR